MNSEWGIERRVEMGKKGNSAPQLKGLSQGKLPRSLREVWSLLTGRKLNGGRGEF